MTPSLLSLPPGCAFRMRCSHAKADCEIEPPFEEYQSRELRFFHPMDQAA
jgi:peptide/nickel transport system ATP-binding protein